MSDGLTQLFSVPALRAGETLFTESRVQVSAQIVAPNRLRGWLKASVRGVPCDLNWERDDLRADCRCGASTRTGLPLCEHIWAAVLWCNSRGLLSGELVARLPERLQSSRPPAQQFRPPAQQFRPPAWVERLRLADQFHQRVPSETEPFALRGALKEGEQVVYLLCKSWKQGLSLQIQRRKRAKGDEWKHTNLRVSPEFLAALPAGEDCELLGLLHGVAREGGASSQLSSGSSFQLTRSEWERLLPRFCATGRCFWRPGHDEEPAGPLAWDEGRLWHLEIAFEKVDAGYAMRLWASCGEMRTPLKRGVELNETLFIQRDHICLLEEQGLSYWRSVTEDPRTGEPLVIGEGEWDGFAEALSARGTLPKVNWPPETRLRQEYPAAVPVARLAPAFSGAHGVFAIAVEFDYGDGRIAPEAAAFGAFHDKPRKTQWLRDRAAERRAIETLLSLDCLKSPKARTVAAASVPALVQALAAHGWRVVGEKVTYRPAHEMRLEVKSGIDWLDLEGSVFFGSVELPLPRLLEAMRAGKHEVELGGGEVGVLPEEWLRQYGLLLSAGRVSENGLRFTLAQSPLLATMLEASPQVRWDERFAELRDGLASFSRVEPAEAPATFRGTLRAYQQEGLGWLSFLRRFGLGGCLADDMGLGKTVQVLAMLEGRRSRPLAPGEGRKPSLVVAPRSVIFNWKQEALRFAPELRVLDYTGAARHEARRQVGKSDLVLTTYGTLRNDVKSLADVTFDYVILDESQAIKNASTASAHAARLLRADHRLALSGTPIENHLRELWSLFEFLNPGMLGVASVFKSAMTDMDQEKLGILSRALRPFILRRTKEQVATELPPCSEQTLYCQLEGDQRRLYDELREHYRASLLAQGGVAGRMQVLEALLRLRQASCHPGLLDDARKAAGSAKIDLLLEKLLPATEEGHKALVFSQFTSLLSLVRTELDSRKVPYTYLDGQTSDRQRVVEQFQQDSACRVFLISLKAGGVGLNLTAAEYVFLLDPWWNPAVESQAIDRAHRIGQTRRVIAYRLIAKDTVEEKVLKLQEQKRQLADAILSAEGGALATLTREDLELLLS